MIYDTEQLMRMQEEMNRQMEPYTKALYRQKALDTDLRWRTYYLQQPLDDNGSPTKIEFNKYSLKIEPITDDPPAISDEMLEKIRKYILDCIFNSSFIGNGLFDGYTVSGEQFRREYYGSWRNEPDPEHGYKSRSSCGIVRVTPGDGQLMRILLGDNVDE